MQAMNYGCGTTVHPRDVARSPAVLYVGVGGGMELLQFAYFSRRPGAVTGIDAVPEMIAAARANLDAAAKSNPWFDPAFVSLRMGDALNLPVPDESAGVVAQNCLFNIFEERDLRRALAEAHRVLKPGGRFVLSDPIAPQALPESLRRDERLRAMCLSGAIPFAHYIELLVEAGFGTIEVRARRPYRVLDPARFGVEAPILLESIEVAAIKDPVPADGACVFTGRTAIYFGAQAEFDDGAGHILQRDLPLAVCDKTALRLACHPEILVTPSTWFYDGGGCC
jgi:SAM-dependent methyltransferase